MGFDRATASCVDTLVHLDDARISDVGAWLKAAASHGISDVVWAGTDPLRDPRARAVASQKPATESKFQHAGLTVWNALGLHPRFLRDNELDAQLAQLRASVGDAVAADTHLCALGEIGLDGRDDSPELALQERAFAEQLQLAREHALPVIIHCVQRIGRLIELLDQSGGALHGGVMHGFAGPTELVQRLSAMGLSFSFGGLLLSPRATRCHDAARAIADHQLLVETDAPDLDASQWPRLLQALATLRNTTPDIIAAQTAANARRVFKMNTINSATQKRST